MIKNPKINPTKNPLSGIFYALAELYNQLDPLAQKFRHIVFEFQLFLD